MVSNKRSSLLNPRRWIEVREMTTGKVMFVETNSSKVQSERPKSMVGKGQADQWLQLRDKASDQLYYYQASTGSSTWSRPSNEHLIIPLDTMQEAIGAVDKVPNERPPSQMTSDQMTRASTGTISSVDTFDEKMVQGLGLAEDSVCVLIKGKEELTAEEIQVQNFIPTQYLVNSSPQTDRVRAPSHSFPHTHTHVSTPTLSAAHTDDMTYGSVVLATNNNKNASSDRLSASITHGTFRAAVSSNGYGMGIQGYDGQVICTHTRTSITSGSSDSLSPGSKVSVCVDVSVCVSPHGETYYDHGHNGVISNNKDSIVATSRRPSNKRCLSTGEFEDVLQIQTQQLLTSAPPERRASHVGHHRSQSECRPVPAPRPQATLRTTQAMSSPEIELNTIADASPIVTPKAQASASDSKRVSVVSPRPTQSQAQKNLSAQHTRSLTLERRATTQGKKAKPMTLEGKRSMWMRDQGDNVAPSGQAINGQMTLPSRKKSCSEENLTHLLSHSRRMSKEEIRPRAMSVRVKVEPDAADMKIKPLEEYNKFFQEKIGIQTTGGLFKKKQSLETSMAWTKDEIRNPMTNGLPKELKRQAADIFKMIQTYMGDRTSHKYVPERDEMREVVRLSKLAYEHKPLRDEVFVQVCKQMTNNPNEESVIRGWEILVMLLHVFPPSHLFEGYIESFLFHHTLPGAAEIYLNEENADNSFVMALFCLKKLRRMEQTGVKGGVPPNVETLTYAKRAAFRPSYFVTTLQNIMLAQSSKFPSLRLPWLLPVLCDQLIKRDGLATEGIFRVPGDSEHVGRLKCMIDEHHYDEKVNDPNIPASLLKMWFRELLEPLVPDELYDVCLDFCDDEARCIDIVDELPDENRHVLKYIINFLQKFKPAPIVEKTLMTIDNIAMVWAPNILRCPSTDPMVILKQSQKERAFVASLITHMDAREYTLLR